MLRFHSGKEAADERDALSRRLTVGTKALDRADASTGTIYDVGNLIIIADKHVSRPEQTESRRADDTCMNPPDTSGNHQGSRPLADYLIGDKSPTKNGGFFGQDTVEVANSASHAVRHTTVGTDDYAGQPHGALTDDS